ncbi:hypothetical protein [Porphyromonas cangingivalis]|uniref:Lipoprotein n=1 Tax=Porphyromonas cangingivalis TaxID=36874 RepID=A0A1T4KX59_PORCN|nr:hypothetical protein [Porphyromonas cangingivalis]KGL48184.1 hypothetical protein HQ34_06675 [Porphyromonas cangingivalis]SJZ47024.1 hypothetical protein SAMN02745205_00896 [Porphyromonas cangingivalis]VEJ04068.1 Uncharacterised protein [Porphyromonas cangingivalis]
MNRFFLYILAVFVFASCTDKQGEELFKSIIKAPPSSIERDVKGHEQIASVQAILRYTRPMKKPIRINATSSVKAYAAYEISQKYSAIPLYQEIKIVKNNQGEFEIESDRKAFDVIKGKDVYYALELKYFDLNNQLINYQFSTYDEKDADASTLEQHQTFFSVQNYSLSKQPLVYPMSLDSVYYEDYLFELNSNKKKIKAGLVTPYVAYAPTAEEGQPIRYDLALAYKAVEAAQTKAATEPYTDPATGKEYRLFKTKGIESLKSVAGEIFRYDYRDTDPVDSEIGARILNDDLYRNRFGQNVGLLRQKRSLAQGAKLDALGFKGLLGFKKSDIAFQMRVCICHIISAKRDSGGNSGHGSGNKGKYATYGYNVHKYNEFPSSWNTFDIDYPLPFRVIADLDGDRTKFLKDVRRYYPQTKEADINNMFGDEESVNTFFQRLPFTRF